jgi:hypothetical protein
VQGNKPNRAASSCKKLTMKTDKNSRTQTRAGADAHPESAVPATNPNREIANCRQLRRAIDDGYTEFHIFLSNGVLSGKGVSITKTGRFLVLNRLDGTFQELTARELYTKSCIGYAMSTRVFIAEGQSHE